MLWGCITSQGVGHLSLIDKTMDSVKYIEILQDALLGTLKDLNVEPGSIIFQQDKDPKHTSKKAKSWFQLHGITVLDWASSSADMNIIEHVWDRLGQLLNARAVYPRNKGELWAAIQEEWAKIDADYIKGLYASMPRRVDALKKVHGGYTKY